MHEMDSIFGRDYDIVVFQRIEVFVHLAISP
jgi:hypothetical protein